MTTTDPEYDRLRDAVVDAAMAWGQSDDLGREDTPEEIGLLYAIAAIRHRAKSPPPDPVPRRCEPPEEHRGLNYHWLKRTDRDGAIVVRWLNADRRWIFEGNMDRFSREDMARMAYSYFAPCTPPSRIEVSEEAIRAFLGANKVARHWSEFVRVIPLALAHFSPTQPAPIGMVLFCPKCGLQHIDEANPAIGWLNEPHRSHLCRNEDGGCGHIWRPADIATNGVLETVTKGKADSPFVSRAQPAPVQQEITDDLLLQLRSIALTRDPSVYLNDARMVVEKVLGR